MRMKHAFTLIELSIVLIIIGLLVGGILAGRGLLEQARLRSIMTEWQEYQTATNTYKLKYDAVPGDHILAESFFGAANTNNGNDDNLLDVFERWLYWQHLQLAELIGGTPLTGLNGGGGGTDAVINENIPMSGYGSGGWMPLDVRSNDHYGLTPKPDHMLIFGDDDGASVPTDGGLQGHLTLEETLQLEAKHDDSTANNGIIRVRRSLASFDNLGCTDATASPNFVYGTVLTSPCTFAVPLNF